MLYYTVLYCMCSVIACTARHGQIVFTSVAPQSSLAQQVVAWLSILYIIVYYPILYYAILYYTVLCCMCSVIACTTRHEICLHSEVWPDCVYWCCPLVLTCTARHGQNDNSGAGPRSLLATQGMARLSWTSCGRTWIFHVPSIIGFIVLLRHV